jgi:guanylate kinase
MSAGNPPRPAADYDVIVVGPCAAGKSSLVARLRAAGVRARSVSQEHSYVP